MKTDTEEIDKDQLVRFVNAQYGLALTSLIFLPRGEDAYTYSASSQDGSHYFVRVQPASRPRKLEHAYAAINLLHHQHGLMQVVAPYATRRGTFTANYGEHVVAVFPFIEGKSLFGHGSWRASDTDLAQAAALLAAIHDTSLSVFMSLPRETFKNPFKSRILRVIEVADEFAAEADSYRGKVGQLLVVQRGGLVATLDRLEQFEAKASQINGQWVLTHGDPNLDNFLKDERGILHLTDWGEIAIGPVERDLKAFAGERFELFLGHYNRNRVTKPIELHPDTFAFYFYLWAMQEIADYATRILFERMGQAEDEHAWEELQGYLPIPHDEIAREKQQLQKVLDRVMS